MTSTQDGAVTNNVLSRQWGSPVGWKRPGARPLAGKFCKSQEVKCA